MNHGYLTALGPAGKALTWDDVRTDLADVAATWLWMDQSGVRCVDQLPDVAPLATHLWGWGASGWYRLRIEPDRVTGARLQRYRADDENSAEGQRVTVAEYLSQGRNNDNERSMLRDADWLRGKRIDIYQVIGSSPMAFFEVPSATELLREAQHGR